MVINQLILKIFKPLLKFNLNGRPDFIKTESSVHGESSKIK
jgi:hypothetical protein